MDVHVSPYFRAFVSLNHGTVGGTNYGSPAAVNRDDLALQQAFAEIMVPLGNDASKAGLRVGRQEVGLGSGNLIAVREPTNIHQSLDGFRAYYDDNSLRVDGFGFDNVATHYGVLEDQSLAHQHYWGLYATQVLPPVVIGGAQSRMFIDPFYIGSSNRQSTFLGFSGSEERHTIGARLWGQVGSADADWTADYQTGTQGAADVSAFAIFTNTGYTFDSLPGKPRIGFRFDMASGGKSGNSLHTYNPLLTTLAYTESNLIAPINFYDTALGVSFSPTNRFRIQPYVAQYWRYSQNDGVYNAIYSTFRNTTHVRGSAIGLQPALRAAYVFNDHLVLAGAVAFFRVDSALANAGAKNNMYTLTQIQFRF